MLALQKATDAGGFARLQTAASEASRTFRNAAASTGMFEVQQLRLNSATDDYVKKLRAQKMGFREMAKQRKIATAAYKEQLAMENMVVRQGVAGNRTNKGVYDVIVPEKASAELDTAGKRLAFMNAELRSGAHQMVNWGKNTQWAGRQLMVGFTMPILAFGAAAGVVAYQLDKEMTRIQKVYDTTATEAGAVTKELEALTVSAFETATAAANEYGQSAQDTLNVQAELAATGKQGAELQKSTMEVMRIARLGEVEHQTAIEATIALQSIFRMSNQELTESFDYMNSIENATSLSTKDFAEAIPVAASAVKAFGGDIKELGILMTAMKENGIGASEGANALKATMQRLGRPSKQIREEWQALTGTDITKLVDDSDGLVEVFTKINQATAGIDEDSRRKAFAGLFGSYQVSKMMALTKGMGELEAGVGQVSAAYEISNQSAEEWAKTAESEMERYQKSISGMWDIAFQSMKVELAEVGAPFVVLATQVVEAITAILKTFNGLPSIAKYFIAGGIAAAALAGGVLMLAGLVGNLVGNLLKGVANLTKFAFGMEIVDKETRAAQLATELSTHAFLEQRGAVEMLTMQLNSLAAAEREARAAMLGHDPASLTSSAADDALLARQQMQAERAQTVSRMQDTDAQGNMIYRYNGQEISRDEADMRAAQIMRDKEFDMVVATNKATAQGLEIDKEREASQARKNKLIAGGTALVAVEGAAMATMLLTSNETANSIAQIAMVAALVGPALGAATPVLKGVATRAGDVKKAVAGAVTQSGMLAGGMKGVGRALLGMMGPVGWIVTGLTVAGGIIYKVWKDQKEATEEAIRSQKNLNSLAEDYAASSGKALTAWDRMRNVQLNLTTKEDTSSFAKDTAYFEDDSDEGGASKVTDFKALESDAERAAYAQKMFIELQTRGGMTANRAAIAVKALYSAADEGAEAATAAADDLLTRLGYISSSDWSGIISDAAGSMSLNLSSVMSDDDETKATIEADVDRIAGMFSEAMTNARPGEGADIMAAFQNAALSGWDEVFNDIKEQGGAAYENLTKAGIDNAQELSEWYKNNPTYDARNQMIGTDVAGLTMLSRMIGAAEVEKRIVSEYAQEYAGLGDNVHYISQLLDEVSLKTRSMSFADAAQEVKEIMASSQVQGSRGAEISEDMAMVSINAFNAAHGFEEGADAAEALANFLGRVRTGAQGAENASGGISGKVKKAIPPAQKLAAILRSMSRADIIDSVRESIEGMQGEMADSWRDGLSDRLAADMQATQDYWDAEKDALSDSFDAQNDALSDRHDAQSDALDARHEREQRGFDAAWDAKREGLEKYWDARVEGIEKAIEAEQKAEEKRVKMFDDEIARIQRLADMANTNIDFNVALNEGNLDEAAKIANTSQAKDAEFIFNREREAGAEKSEKRVEKLGDRQESVEEAKEAAMKAFDAREEAASAHFQKMQEMESESLQKRQELEQENLDKRADMAKDNLDKRAEADIKAKEADHQRQKDNLERVLKTFLAFTPQNKKQLEAHAAELGLSLKEFGQNTLKPMSMTWGEWYKKNVGQGIIDSHLAGMSTDAWKKLGTKAKLDILQALGFETESKFDKFIDTGKLGDAGGGDALYGSDKVSALAGSKGKPEKPKPQHVGGWVDGSAKGGGRKGVAKNYSGNHPSEQLIRAQKGEYIVNRKAAAANGPLLDNLNAGIGGYSGGPAPYMMGILGAAALKGIGKALSKKKNEAVNAGVDGPAGSAGAAGGTMGFIQGGGGRHAPTVTAALSQGLHPTNAVDIAAPKGSPAFAVADGVVAASYDIRGHESRRRVYGLNTQDGFASYGRVVSIDHGGFSSLYAHLQSRAVTAKQRVKGGAVIGAVGNTGNVQSYSGDGTHLHFGVSAGSPYSFLSLRKGAEYVKYDNTMANLHRGESVLTKNLTSKMHEGVDRFAKGGDSQYNVEVNINGYNGDANELANLVVSKIRRETARAPQSRTVG